MKKRSIVLFLCLIMLLGIVFAGCTPSGAQATPTAKPSGTATAPATDTATKPGDDYRIFLYHLSNPDDAFDASYRGQEQKKRKEQLEEDFGITITIIGNSISWDSLTASAAAGTPEADMMMAGGPFLLHRFYMHAGIAGSALDSVSNYPVAEKFNDSQYWDTEVQNNITTFNDKLYYVVPKQIGIGSVSLAQVTIFNKRLVEAAGFPATQLYDWSSKGEWTWERFEQVAVAATQKDSEIYGLMRSENNGPAFSLTASNGGAYITRKEVDGKQVDRYTGMDAKAIEAWNFYVGLNTKGALGPAFVGNDQTEFPTGKYAMALTYVNRADTYSTKMEDDYGILMVPKAPGAESYVSDQNWFDPFCMMLNVPNPAGTAEVLYRYYQPIMAADSAENLALFDQEADTIVRDAESKATLTATLDVIKVSSFMVYVDIKNVGQAIMGNTATEKLLSGEITPAAFFSSIESQVNAAIDEMNTDKTAE